MKVLKNIALALALMLPSSAPAQYARVTSTMYIESGDHCEEAWPDQVDVKVMMDMTLYPANPDSSTISIWRCGLDYWNTYWVPTGADMGSDMPAGSVLIFNPNPQGWLPTYGTNSFVLLGITPTNTPIPAGTGKHVATIHMNRTGYPVNYGCTAIKFNGAYGHTDWTNVGGSWGWGYGWPNTVLLNGKWKLRNNSCDYVQDCPSDYWSPCPKCPPELEGKALNDSTSIQRSTWGTIKGLYKN